MWCMQSLNRLFFTRTLMSYCHCRSGCVACGTLGFTKKCATCSSQEIAGLSCLELNDVSGTQAGLLLALHAAQSAYAPVLGVLATTNSANVGGGQLRPVPTLTC